MKNKSIITLLFVLLITAPNIGYGIGLETPVLPGDIVLFRSYMIHVFGFEYPVCLIELCCFNIYTFWYHAEIVYDKNGGIVTSAPPDGTGHTSTLSHRYEEGTWNKIALLRNKKLNEEQIESVLDTAFSLDSDYDWMGYYLHILDLFTSCSILNLFRSTPRQSDNYHCVSATAFSFEKNEIHVSKKATHITTPWDIINYASDENTDWEIIEVCDLDE